MKNKDRVFLFPNNQFFILYDAKIYSIETSIFTTITSLNCREKKQKKKEEYNEPNIFHS